MLDESLFNKFADPQALGLRFYNTVITQVFSCEICEIFWNTFFYRTLLVAASVVRVSDMAIAGIQGGRVIFLL